MKSYLNKNFVFWNREYNAPNTESFIFRLKPHLLDRRFNLKNKKSKIKVLDFGCGEGSNLNFFLKSYKWEPYRVDISEHSLHIAQAKMKLYSDNFKLLENNRLHDIKDFPNVKFDLIIAIQSLYYLGKIDLNKTLITMKKLLKPNGVVFFTMISKKNEYYKKYSNKKTNKDGLTLVNLGTDKHYKKRQRQNTYKHYINFVKNSAQLKNLFNMFKPLNVGQYDLSLLDEKKSFHHYTFFGK